jgi:ATP-dependent helicase/nuclease subunit A
VNTRKGVSLKMENKIKFKAVIKEASAGTGKTHSIINEILELKKIEGSYEVLRKILAVTFSENAALELKERLIYSILNEDYKNLSDDEKIKLQNILLKLNFSTIHSFARKILKRFSFFIQIDPFFQIMDRKESDILFNEALTKTFSDSEEIKIFYEILKNIKSNKFLDLIFEMRRLHPYIFLGRPAEKSEMTKKILEFYKKVDEKYFELKKKLGYLDFDDLEKKSYELLIENQNTLLILEDFDEKINFIFIDEFQDTNLLQWEIIKKLIEEWISGYGAKAEGGENYGIYIVGDKKQSIYKFRGAERNVFEEAKRTLENYYSLEKLKRNFRSTSQIINFVNKVFENDNDWKNEELEFEEETGNLQSKVEINIFENKEKEYEFLCNKICSILSKEIMIYDRKNKTERKIEAKDILILMRKRGESFALLEGKLKEYNIPYVIIGGIGFYQEEEIKFLLSLIYCLIDPTDKYSLWNLKNSVFKINKEKVNEWREKLSQYEISSLVENILKEIKFKDYLDTQGIANVEKFLSILQNQSYLPHYQISKNLRELSKNQDEPKADIFSIHQDAVKIMTIHGAKGLEFPVVFLINLEDLSYNTQKDEFFYLKDGEGYVYTYKKESFSEFKSNFEREMLEEENRLLYVALTRAMQYLFISGTKGKKGNHQILNKIERLKSFYQGEFEEGKKLEIKSSEREKFNIEGFNYKPVLSFTKEKKQKNYSFYENIIGSIVHKIIEEISNGVLEYKEEKIKERVIFYLKKEVDEIEKYKNEIFKIFENIGKNKEVEKIINEKVSENVKSELPFIYESESGIYEGVIDKIFIEEGKVKIYEFKTFLKDVDEYKEQIRIYRDGARRIFNNENVECYIINLSKAQIIPVDF